jgi:hypothetical protein
MRIAEKKETVTRDSALKESNQIKDQQKLLPMLPFEKIQNKGTINDWLCSFG